VARNGKSDPVRVKEGQPHGRSLHEIKPDPAGAGREGTRQPRDARTCFTQWRTHHVATVLNKELKRQVTVDGVDYTVALDLDGLRLTGKGRRKPEVELRWRDLLSGDAALAVALNASLSKKPQPATGPSPDRASKRVASKTPR